MTKVEIVEKDIESLEMENEPIDGQLAFVNTGYKTVVEV